MHFRRARVARPVILMFLVSMAALAATLPRSARADSSSPLDGVGKTDCSSNWPSCTRSQLLTTTQNDDVIIVVALGTSSTTVTDSSGLSFTQRLAYPFAQTVLVEFYAVASSPLHDDNITVSDAPEAKLGMQVLAIHGANTGAIFDSAPSVPATVSCPSPDCGNCYADRNTNPGPCSASIETSSTDFVIATTAIGDAPPCGGYPDSPAGYQRPPGFTEVAASGEFEVDYMVSNNPPSNVVFDCYGTDAQAIALDAIAITGSSPTVYTLSWQGYDWDGGGEETIALNGQFLASLPTAYSPQNGGTWVAFSLNTTLLVQGTNTLTFTHANFDCPYIDQVSNLVVSNQTSTVYSNATVESINTASSCTNTLTYTFSVQEPISQTTFAASGFDGLDMYVARSGPPDVQVAAGPQYVVELVNGAGEIWTNQGTVVKTFDTRSFFNMSSYGGDPRILFDNLSGRWFASAISPSGVRLAVSQTSSPLGNWSYYDFADSYFADQPIIGVSDDKLVISVNDFSCQTCGFVGAQFWVVKKADLLLGASPQSLSYGPFGQWFSIHPAQSLTTSPVLFMVNSYGASCCYLFQVSGVPPNVAVQYWSYGVSSSLPYTSSPSAPQNATTTRLDTGDTRIQDAYWKNGKLWLAFNDGCTPQGDTQLRSCIRLAKIDTATHGTVDQNFDLGSPGEYYFYPALRPDNQGNLAIVFGYSSSTDYPGLMVTAQPSGGPPNTVEPPVILKSGLAPESTSSSSRYGDYFGAASDPSNSTLVWVAGEYGTLLQNGQYGWGSFIAAVDFR